jgi:hypothetical protein
MQTQYPNGFQPGYPMPVNQYGQPLMPQMMPQAYVYPIMQGAAIPGQAMPYAQVPPQFVQVQGQKVNPFLQPPPGAPAKPKRLINRLQESLSQFLTKDDKAERPIGISQLTKETFQAHTAAPAGSIFKTGQARQDYRFKPSR